MANDTVLVLDSQGPNGLALCRALGKRGVSVTAGGFSRYLPGMFSRYTDGSYVHPDPVEDQSAFVDHLYDHLERADYDAVVPVVDQTTSVLARHKARLEETGTAVGAEDWETFLSANDKGRLFEMAADIDVPSPRTHAPSSMADVERVDAERTYPVVIKPRRTTFTDDEGQSVTNRIGASNYVGEGEDLVERFRTIIDGSPSLKREYPLVQEYVDGVETMATVGLADEGALRAFFQHKKFRVYPPSGGIGAVRQGTWEPLMKEYTERVLDALEWSGPVHVEFMKTHDDDFYLLEVNGRYWGSLALTINSGVDIPWLHYNQLCGRRVSLDLPSNPGYRRDVKQRKLFYTDLLWLHDQLSRGNVSALLPFAASFFTTRDEFLDTDDPLPMLGLAFRTAKVLSNRRKGMSMY